MLNLRIARPEAVIDLGRVDGLAGISEWDGGVAFGAMTRQRAAEQSALVQQRAPLVTRALANVGHVTIRNRGTIGGSIAHADPAAELPAAALALDAELVVRSAARGERTIAAADFFQGFLTTALEPDELLVEVRVPGVPAGAGVSFVELARRHGDFAIVGAAAVVSPGDTRLVFIGVGGAPVRATEAEELLREGASYEEAAERAASTLDPASDLHASADYRRRVAKVLARRALEEATP
jgi:CO/xanthine dehydrogenase FAD-binding subunit